MWTLTLALCAFIANVDGQVVKPSDPVITFGVPKIHNEIAIDHIFVYEWSGKEGDVPKPIHRRAHIQSWAVREGDHICIIPPVIAPGAKPLKFPTKPLEYQKVTNIEGAMMTLGENPPVNFETKIKAGNLFVMTNDRNGAVKDMGWILVAEKKVPKEWGGIKDQSGEEYNENKAILKAKAKAEKEAEKEAQQKEHQKTLLYIAQHKARYADDGDYYGYAGGAYDEEDIGYQGIDSSRLMQYAYKRGLYAGSKKANRIKRRKDYR